MNGSKAKKNLKFVEICLNLRIRNNWSVCKIVYRYRYYLCCTWCNLPLISQDSQFHCCRITTLSKQQLYLLLNNRDLFQGNTVIPVSAEILIRKCVLILILDPIWVSSGSGSKRPAIMQIRIWIPTVNNDERASLTQILSNNLKA